MLYGSLKFKDLINHEDSSFQTYTEYDAYDMTNELTFGELGLNPVIEVWANHLTKDQIRESLSLFSIKARSFSDYN